jgi:hypothetical protein
MLNDARELFLQSSTGFIELVMADTLGNDYQHWFPPNPGHT